MKIHLDIGALRGTKWYEYAERFAFGGAVTALAGLIAKECGPVIGGLFLAFPAIFPASASLIEKRQNEKKLQVGANPRNRGKVAVALDAAGAAMGSVGLLVFAFLVWRLLPEHSAPLVLVAGTIAWVAVSVAIWRTCDYL